MTKRIEDTAAAKSLSAWVILNKKGEQIGRVQVYYANSGGVTVEVHQWGDDVMTRVALAMGYTLTPEGRIDTFNGKKTPHAGEWPYVVAAVQRGHAGGYGYDKKTAALSGLNIDGHVMSDHCRGELKRPRGRLWHDSDRARVAKKGYRLSNYVGAVDPDRDRAAWNRPKDVRDDDAGYVNAHRLEGFGYPESQGYRFLQAI